MRDALIGFTCGVLSTAVLILFLRYPPPFMQYPANPDADANASAPPLWDEALIPATASSAPTTTSPPDAQAPR